ncbi:MAG: LacI family DNA-binding transcriptional regulator [Phycisphaeraceae bacterium JB051]
MKLQDLAEKADVSPATVSRVFSHHPNIRPEIRKRVLALARKHGYFHRLSAKQKNVVIILPDNEIYPIRNCLEMAMMALTQELPRRDFRIEVLPQGNMDRLDSIQFCGAVAIGAEPGDFKHWEHMYSAPLVLVDRDVPFESSSVYSVRSDEMQGMALAIEHFHQRGCKKIGTIIHGLAGTGNADQRHAGIMQGLKQFGYPAHEGLVHLARDEQYMELIGKLLNQGVDALFCPGGNAGIITAYALSIFNKQVPHDVSLITSEYKFYSAFATPPQTTITQDHQALAKTATDMIESHLTRSPSVRQVLLPYSMNIRESVRYKE